MKKKLKYPIYKKSKINGCVVKFIGLYEGTVVKDTERSIRANQEVGFSTYKWAKHTDSKIWGDYDYKDKQ